MSSDEGSTRDTDSVTTLPATAALPFPALEQATFALRGQLRATRDERALPAGPVHVLEWDTLVVDGPVVDVDPDGRSWFTYTAQVSTRALRPVD